MRTTVLFGLMFAFAMAACGDSSSDDDKNDDDKKNDDDNGTDVGAPETDAGMLGDIDDGELDDCDKGDPCCINSDEYDFTRCNTIKDAGTE